MFGVIGSNRVAVALCISICVEKKSKGQECAEETKTRLPKNWLYVIGSHMLACRCRSFRGSSHLQSSILLPFVSIPEHPLHILSVVCRVFLIKPCFDSRLKHCLLDPRFAANKTSIVADKRRQLCRVDFLTLPYPLRIQRYTFLTDYIP
jgi:hypothetical protein